MSNYNLFISHSWAYTDSYQKLLNILNNQISTKFNFRNYSVPKDDPIHTSGSDKALKDAIYSKISCCSNILILAGVYATYSRWINIEIDIANQLNKKIIAIQPWGAERTSLHVKNNASHIVNWNGNSIVQAIKS